jgi:glycosyltransferase involved in cell wall biosynthesis
MLLLSGGTNVLPLFRIDPVRNSTRGTTSTGPATAGAVSAAGPGPAARRPLRLLQVLGYAGDGRERFGITGVERVVQLLVEGLDPRRFEHYLVYPRVGALYDVYREHSREILPLEAGHRYDPAFVNALARFARAHDVDVVLSHGLRLDFLTGLATRRLRRPHLVSRAVALADEPMPVARRLLFTLLDAWTLRSCQGIVAVSAASKARMARTQRLPEAKITVIENGVRLPLVSSAAREDARRALGIEPSAPLVGGAGQLIARKDFEVLVEALARISPKYPRLVGLILGEGPERPRLEALARARGVRLLLPGYVPDPYPALAALDVAVLPSRAEGLPMVVLESMALGVATAATRVAGTPEIIEDGASGLLFPPGDVPALAAALERLLGDDRYRHQIGEAGARRVESRYSLDAMLRGFEARLLRAAGWVTP